MYFVIPPGGFTAKTNKEEHAMIKGDIKATTFKGKKVKCELISKHDLNNYNGWWYVNLIHDDGRSLGLVIRPEKKLNEFVKEDKR